MAATYSQLQLVVVVLAATSLMSGLNTIPNVGSSDSDTLVLTAGQYIESPGSKYYLIMQADCNLVLYSNSDPPIIPFATGTFGRGQDCYTRMQADCNLVIYDGNNVVMWSSQTNRNDVADTTCMLAVEDTGTVAIWANYKTKMGEKIPIILWENGIIKNSR